jgi:hypothetical protein
MLVRRAADPFGHLADGWRTSTSVARGVSETFDRAYFFWIKGAADRWPRPHRTAKTLPVLTAASKSEVCVEGDEPLWPSASGVARSLG